MDLGPPWALSRHCQEKLPRTPYQPLPCRHLHPDAEPLASVRGPSPPLLSMWKALGHSRNHWPPELSCRIPLLCALSSGRSAPIAGRQAARWPHSHSWLLGGHRPTLSMAARGPPRGSPCGIVGRLGAPGGQGSPGAGLVARVPLSVGRLSHASPGPRGGDGPLPSTGGRPRTCPLRCGHAASGRPSPGQRAASHSCVCHGC